MKPRKTKEIRSVLEHKGFVAANRDHVFMFLYIAGKKTSVRTKLSHGLNEYGADLLKLMSHQLHLTATELDQLLDCPLTYQRYVELLTQRGILSN